MPGQLASTAAAPAETSSSPCLLPSTCRRLLCLLCLLAARHAGAGQAAEQVGVLKDGSQEVGGELQENKIGRGAQGSELWAAKGRERGRAGRRAGSCAGGDGPPRGLPQAVSSSRCLDQPAHRVAAAQQ